MTEQKPWKYIFDHVQSRSKAAGHEAGRLNPSWAGCQFNHFGPEGEKNILLTSPFIEQISQISQKSYLCNS
jgi:hypothetical protein